MPADAAPSWLRLAELGAVGERIEFSEADLHYLIRVCRARAGERVTATDGRGGIAVLRLEAEGASVSGRIESLECRVRTREAWLLCGSPEMDRGDWLVEKLAELGIAVLQPVECARGGWDRAARRRERWLRLAAAAVRQSRSPFQIELREPVPLLEALDALPAGGSRWLADEAGPRGRSASAVESPAVGAVGPAGGFDEDEWSSLRARGFEPIGLSPSRLRSETAALAWASWWSAG